MVSTLVSLLSERKFLPPLWLSVLYNIISAGLIALSFSITINYLPNLYKDIGLNNGSIQLSTKSWNQVVQINASEDLVNFSLCGQTYNVKNRISTFYNKLNESLTHCELEDLQIVKVKVINDPFRSIMDKTSNSILRKLL